MTSVLADPRHVILEPVESEKSYSLIAFNKYTFKVHPDAHKTQIRQAMEQLFGVHVEDVKVIKVPPKPKRRGAIKGKKPGFKKAIIKLREGDSIELFEGAR